jgi:Transposase DDE domain.
MDVEYPTDIGLLEDAMRKTIILTSRLCAKHTVAGWRQSGFSLRRLKCLQRKAQQSKRSRKANAQLAKEKAHRRYLKHATHYLEKSLSSCEHLNQVVGKGLEPQRWSRLQSELAAIADFQEHAQRQIDQICRRVLEHESIPSDEKVYSVFEPKVEWICKGKAGVPFELGIKVCIIEDQHQFILHHRVMQKEEDASVAITMIEATKAKFPNFNACSFDKGFHSPDNQEKLPELLKQVVLPRKGKATSADQEKAKNPEYKKARRQHSAVESAINALEHHGLDRCLDHGIDGFKRYVGLSIVARNLQRIGAILAQRERDLLRKQKKLTCSERLRA